MNKFRKHANFTLRITPDYKSRIAVGIKVLAQLIFEKEFQEVESKFGIWEGQC